jgi:hypothetical protein
MNGELQIGYGGPEDHCKHLNDSYISDEGTDQWVFGPDGWPMCKAFIPKGEPITEPDTLTIDMFEAPIARQAQPAEGENHG